jgi:8-oxo-dGTP diphosphatase/2-hydroxy-dATP diphosphatase
MESPEAVEKDYTLLFCRRRVQFRGAEAEEGADDAQGVRREVLLGMKKRGFGAGRWNGFGGKVDPGESFEAAAIRELEEESGIKTHVIIRRGFLVFFLEDRNMYMKVHVFESWDFDGDGEETEEMQPQWFAEDELPFGQMWPDDQYWLSTMLHTEQKSFVGR